MRPWLDDGDVQLYHGDACEVLRSLPAGSVQTCVTSPPYWGLRDYGTGSWTGGDADCDHLGAPHRTQAGFNERYFGRESGTDKQGELREPYGAECGRCGAQRVDAQLGLEATPSLYVAALVAVFAEVWRVLRADGTCWINLGDCYAHGAPSGTAGQWNGSSPLGGNGNAENATKAQNMIAGGTLGPGLKAKDLVGVPWRVAFALQQPFYSGRIKDERDRIWLAAILDAEGCIHIHKRSAGAPSGAKFTKKDGTEVSYARTQDTYGVMVSIDNTSLALMNRCHELIGQGSRYTHEAGVGKSNRKQTLHRLTLTGQQSRELIRELYPHLVAKQHQARIAYHSASNGPDAEAAWQAVKMLHNGIETTVDAPAPPTLFSPGWYLRSDIIWGKPNPMPESVTDRPTKAHEYVFLLAKQPRYFYDADAIREPSLRVGETPGGDNMRGVGEFGVSPHAAFNGPVPAARNVRSVWEIATQPTPEAHFATFPEALVRRCILAGSSEAGGCAVCGAPWQRQTERTAGTSEAADRPKAAAGHGGYGGRKSTLSLSGNGSKEWAERGAHSVTTGWVASCQCGAPAVPQQVLDPFVGSGTTALVARKHGRRAIGIDLSADYLEIAARRLGQQSLFATSEGAA